jgi:hypothetical protein
VGVNIWEQKAEHPATSWLTGTLTPLIWRRKTDQPKIKWHQEVRLKYFRTHRTNLPAGRQSGSCEENKKFTPNSGLKCYKKIED